MPRNWVAAASKVGVKTINELRGKLAFLENFYANYEKAKIQRSERKKTKTVCKVVDGNYTLFVDDKQIEAKYLRIKVNIVI